MATNATIVQRLNEKIKNMGGVEKGSTISECLGIMNSLDKSQSDGDEEEGSTAEAVAFFNSLSVNAM